MDAVRYNLELNVTELLIVKLSIDELIREKQYKVKSFESELKDDDGRLSKSYYPGKTVLVDM